MEPTYQQISDIIMKRIDNVVKERGDLKQPLKINYTYESTYETAIDVYFEKHEILKARLNELSLTLSEILALKESLNNTGDRT